MLKYFILILCFMSCKIGLLYSNDIREFEVGTSIKSIPEERYANIRCLDSDKLLKLIFVTTYDITNDINPGLSLISQHFPEALLLARFFKALLANLL